MTRIYEITYWSSLFPCRSRSLQILLKVQRDLSLLSSHSDLGVFGEEEDGFNVHLELFLLVLGYIISSLSPMLLLMSLAPLILWFIYIGDNVDILLHVLFLPPPVSLSHDMTLLY